jgi:hypothetical protein
VGAPGSSRATVGRPWLATGTALFLLLGGSRLGATGTGEPAGGTLNQATIARRSDLRAAGYRPGGTLGFTLRETAISEHLARRVEGDERGLLWSAEFTSRWPLTESQLDRWSA